MPEATTLRRPAAPALADAAASAPLFPVRLERVGFDVNGETLLGDVSFDLDAEAFTAIMGPNGSGKTLLLRLMHGLLTPTRGRISWAGGALTEARRRCQAMVFQKPVLLRRSVAANVDFALSIAGRGGEAGERDALLDRLGLGALASRPARKLSGGEQQRLALARALAFRPGVMFLDEPTASLDPGSVLMIETVVRWAREQGAKIVLVTHDIGQARRLADEVVFLHRGRLAERTPAAAFFEKPETQAARDFLAGRIVL